MSEQQADSFHAPLTDSNGSVWTWRGSGYAIVSQPDMTPDGKPWTTSAETVKKLFGVHAGASTALATKRAR